MAASAHLDQRRFDGSPYILHPLRLMFKVEGELAQMAAVLHDVVEDTPWTLDQLRGEGFSEELLVAVGLLTHEDGVSYDDYIERISSNPIARRVKMADLEDNMSLLEIPELSQRDLDRAQKYHLAWNRLKDSL